MTKSKGKTQARIEILKALKRATAQAQILNKQLDEMHSTLVCSVVKKAA